MKAVRYAFLSFLALTTALPASATTVTAQYTGLRTSKSVTVSLGGSTYGTFQAGEMKVKIDGGPEEPAYCVDPYTSINTTPYAATLQSAPVDPMWCQIAYILDNYTATSNDMGAAIQTAVWKLLEGTTYFTVSPAAIETLAMSIIAASEDKCPLACLNNPLIELDGEFTGAGTVTVTATLTEGGQPVFGETVTFTTTNGTISGSASVMTDANGEATVTLTGVTAPPTVNAFANGTWLKRIVPQKNLQTLAMFRRDPCTVEDSLCIDNETCYDLGLAQDFNVFSCTDYTGGLDVLGKVAAARDAAFQSFSIGSANPGGNALVVGRRLSANDGTIYGNAVYGLSHTVSNFQAGGTLQQGSPIDFAAECAEYVGTSAGLAALPRTGTTLIRPWKAIELRGNRPGLNVFTVSASAISKATSLLIRVPAGATALINVSGATVKFANFKIFTQGATENTILWNLSGATSVTIESFEFVGSLLAPNANVVFNNGQMLGTMIAGNLSGSGEFYDEPFEGEVCTGQSCAGVTPPTAPTCHASYSVVNSWQGGFQSALQITYNGPEAIDAWELEFAFANGELLTNGWEGDYDQSGAIVTVQNAEWNGLVDGDAGTISIGFTGKGAAQPVTGIKVNGVLCQ